MSLALPSPLPPDEERAQTLEEVWWTEIALATVFIGLRYWTRLSSQRKLLLDDIVMGLAWVRRCRLLLPHRGTTILT